MKNNNKNNNNQTKTNVDLGAVGLWHAGAPGDFAVVALEGDESYFCLTIYKKKDI